MRNFEIRKYSGRNYILVYERLNGSHTLQTDTKHLNIGEVQYQKFKQRLLLFSLGKYLAKEAIMYQILPHVDMEIQ